MLTIRLQRVGKKNNPDFRVVLAEKHRAASKKIIEIFGEYNPKSKRFHLPHKENLLAWLEKNIEVSPTVKNLLISNQIISGQKVKAWRPKVKKQTEKAKQAANKAEAAAKPTQVETPTPEKTEQPKESPVVKTDEPTATADKPEQTPSK